MRFGIFNKFGALNSQPVFEAFEHGLKQLGLEYRSHDVTSDVAVIWSQVWAGRMQGNQQVWQYFRNNRRPVIVLEVGLLDRGKTWKVGVNGTGNTAYWGQGLDANRVTQLGLALKPWRSTGSNIVIAAQRSDSEQWHEQPDAAIWVANTIKQVQTHSTRPIILRTHPRQRVVPLLGCTYQVPQKLANSYDDFDFDQCLQDAWAVINWNSGPGVQAAIAGVPVFVGASSLAAPVGNQDLSQIEKPVRPDRANWLVDIAHTEWTVEEIATGYPIKRLLPGLQFK
jgi:hypothetical protein